MHTSHSKMPGTNRNERSMILWENNMIDKLKSSKSVHGRQFESFPAWNYRKIDDVLLASSRLQKMSTCLQRFKCFLEITLTPFRMIIGGPGTSKVIHWPNKYCLKSNFRESRENVTFQSAVTDMTDIDLNYRHDLSAWPNMILELGSHRFWARSEVGM